MIRIINVSKQYQNNGKPAHLALNGLNLEVKDKEFLCILGPSGCGKTTLLNLIAGFVRPTSGQVLMEGAPVKKPGPDRCVVFQDATLFPWLTAKENVEFPLLSSPMSPRERSENAIEMLKTVGLMEGIHSFPHALSGGMRQRVALARVLMLNPKVLLMDEPFSALDPFSRQVLREELLRIWGLKKRTMIFVTHSVEEAAFLADRVIVMGLTPIEVKISSPRPRAQNDPAFQSIFTQLKGALAS